MTANRGFLSERRLTVSQQRARMMMIWPSLKTEIDGKMLAITGVVQPTPIARRYTVRIVYKEFGIPRAYVLNPLLTRRPDAPDVLIPHTYDAATPGSERPCLFHPRRHDWNASMAIASSVMPWLLTWLIDYEIWQATGEWLGGGAMHGDGPKSTNAEQVA